MVEQVLAVSMRNGAKGITFGLNNLQKLEMEISRWNIQT